MSCCTAHYTVEFTVQGAIPIPLDWYRCQVTHCNRDRGTTVDKAHALGILRQVRAGGVKINGSTMLSLNLMAPRPAWGLSGAGVEGTTETFYFFTNSRVVGVENLSAADLAKMAG